MAGSKEGGLTPKKEAFAAAYVETGNASEAYRIAYNVRKGTKPESIWTNACKLMSQAKVLQRVELLREQARERHAVTIDTLTAELDEARTQAIADPKGASAHVAAIMGKAKLHGLLIDKGETKHTGTVTQIQRTIVDPED